MKEMAELGLAPIMDNKEAQGTKTEIGKANPGTKIIAIASISLKWF